MFGVLDSWAGFAKSHARGTSAISKAEQRDMMSELPLEFARYAAVSFNPRGGHRQVDAAICLCEFN